MENLRFNNLRKCVGIVLLLEMTEMMNKITIEELIYSLWNLLLLSIIFLSNFDIEIELMISLYCLIIYNPKPILLIKSTIYNFFSVFKKYRAVKNNSKFSQYFFYKSFVF
jgi:hypothetical protein